MKAEELDLLKRHFPEPSVTMVGEVFLQRCFSLRFKKEGRRPWTINNEKYGEIPENVVLPDEGRVVIK